MIYYCPDCAVQEGELHEEGCDMERCMCGRQKLMCETFGDCSVVGKEEREPFFSEIGYFCQRCWQKYPDMIMVSNENWKKICGATYQLDCVLCESCMDFIAEKRGMGKLKKAENLLELEGKDGPSN